MQAAGGLARAAAATRPRRVRGREARRCEAGRVGPRAEHDTEDDRTDAGAIAAGTTDVAPTDGGDLTDLLRACLVALRLPADRDRYQPRQLPFWSFRDATARISRLLPALPAGGSLGVFLPEVAERGADRDLQCRASVAAVLGGKPGTGARRRCHPGAGRVLATDPGRFDMIREDRIALCIEPLAEAGRGAPCGRHQQRGPRRSRRGPAGEPRRPCADLTGNAGPLQPGPPAAFSASFRMSLMLRPVSVAPWPGTSGRGGERWCGPPWVNLPRASDAAVNEQGLSP